MPCDAGTRGRFALAPCPVAWDTVFVLTFEASHFRLASKSMSLLSAARRKGLLREYIDVVEGSLKQHHPDCGLNVVTARMFGVATPCLNWESWRNH
jgi:hypothetical protein